MQGSFCHNTQILQTLIKLYWAMLMGQSAFKYFRPTAHTHKSCTCSWRTKHLWQVGWQPIILTAYLKGLTFPSLCFSFSNIKVSNSHCTIDMEECFFCLFFFANSNTWDNFIHLETKWSQKSQYKWLLWDWKVLYRHEIHQEFVFMKPPCLDFHSKVSHILYKPALTLLIFKLVNR